MRIAFVGAWIGFGNTSLSILVSVERSSVWWNAASEKNARGARSPFGNGTEIFANGSDGHGPTCRRWIETIRCASSGTRGPC